MKALVISGGADKIPFGAGAGTALRKKNKKNYDIYIGTSAGALNVSLLNISEFDRLYDAVTESEPKDYFNIIPFGKNGGVKPLALARAIIGKPSLGLNKKFADHLRKYFTEDIFGKMKKEKKQVCVGVTNYSTMEVEYPCLVDYDYDTAILWLMASSQIPIIVQPLKINGQWYFDGGVIDHVGILEAIEKGAIEIDVIMHRPMKFKPEESNYDWEPKGIFSVINRTLETMVRNVSFDDVEMASLKAKDNNVRLNIYYTPYKLTDKLYSLNKNTLKSWYEMGKNVVTAKEYDGIVCHSYHKLKPVNKKPQD